MVPPNFEHLNAHLPAAALKATRHAALLPIDIAFHKSMDPDFAMDLDELSSKVLSITNRLLELSSTIDSAGKGKSRLETEDDVLDSFESCVVDRVDHLLERVDSSLDEYLGRSKAPAIAVNLVAEKKKLRSAPDIVVQHAAHLDKPQQRFKVQIDNSNTPWYPRLKHKYNATVPLGHIFLEEETAAIQGTHPYRYEIKHLSYPPRMFSPSPPISPKHFDSTSFTWVETVDALGVMLARLRQASEIAVDLEHHSYRTYAGFLCLMQLSTRDEDWIIDAIALRHELEVLNEVFTDSKITKVFHGAESDIVWLQQDLNLYIVNLFDTYHASKVLSFPKHGLANLLEMYCDFTPDKRYQLADWRVRPLPEPMLRYARSDTHFLLYVYDNLRNALLDRGASQSRTSDGAPVDILVKQVLTRSEETALKVYEKDAYDAAGGGGSGGWDNLARKWNKLALASAAPDVGPTAVQKHVYKAVHAWRDRVAREEDESTRFVLPNHFLFQFAETPPPDLPALLRVFHSPPPVIKRRANELLDAIREAVKANYLNAEMVQAVEEAEVDDVDMSPAAATAEVEETSSLWSSGGPSATHSTLFAAAPLGRTQPTSLSSSKSALFGSAPHARSTVDASRLFDVVNRIHGTLSIAPSIPTVPSAVAVEAEDQVHNESVLEMKAEVPFVPAAQRVPREVVDDALVVVGQTKQKKRKRTAPESAAASGSKKTKQQDEDPEAPFDFSAVPNVLDQVAQEETKLRKRERKKAGGGFYGDFPAAPKAQNEPRSGNQSYTFRQS